MNSPAKRSLSQNFLVDRTMIDQLVGFCCLDTCETVLEIGPGKGALTREIVPRVKKVITIEKDDSLASLIVEHLPMISMIHNDMLQVNICEIFEHTRAKTLKLISNLPYNISTAATRWIICNEIHFHAMYLMVQKEFALKLSTQPPQHPLAAYLQHHWSIKLLTSIPGTCYSPMPRVTSAFIELLPKGTPPPSGYLSFLELCYSARKKKLSHALKGSYSEDQIEKAYSTLSIEPNSRTHQLQEPELFALFCALSAQ